MYALHYGNAKKPLALVQPDERHPTMWRIHWPDGSVSDMVNLTRARDAAQAIAERGPPPQRPRDRKLFHWKQDASKTARAGAYSGFAGDPVPDSPPAAGALHG